MKLTKYLFVLALILAGVFGVLLILPSTKENELGRIDLWCGLASQLLLAVTMFSEIRRIKKEDK